MRLSTTTNPNPPITTSIILWRLRYGEIPTSYKVNKDGLCVHCNGSGYINEKNFGKLRCLCQLINYTIPDIISTFGEIRTDFPSGNIERLIEWSGSNLANKEIAELKTVVRKWEHYPKGWLTIIGRPGTGKTEIMTWLAKRLYPWALYITDPNFESIIHNALNKEVPKKSYNNIIYAIQRAPILLYDDYGSGYGSKFSASSLRSVIDWRYANHSEYLTVVTSNLSRAKLKMLDPRIADRILDQDRAQVVVLQNVDSWRTRDDNSK